MKRKRNRSKKVGQTRGGLTPSQLQQVAGTATGELFQPARMHYSISDPTKVERTLLKLECLDADRPRQRLVWLYMQEAAYIQFPSATASNDKPVVIGELCFHGPDEMVLNVRSIERALAAVEFFDQYLPRTLARLTHMTVFGHLYSVGDALEISSLNQLFEETSPVEVDQDAILPEIENIPVHFYQDGISPLQLQLRVKQAVAWEHWQGNATYTAQDAICDLMQ